MFSIRTAYELTGAVELYDRPERIAFNALPATTDQNFGGNAYYHSINQIHMSGKTASRSTGAAPGMCTKAGPSSFMSQVQRLHSDPSTIVVSAMRRTLPPWTTAPPSPSQVSTSTPTTSQSR